jgi:TonB-linked SusC/RagA family outer membrane protein
MKRMQLFILLVLAFGFVPGTAFGQERATITGRVIDAATTQPLVGVLVVVVGTNLGELTNQEGRYRIVNAPTGAREVRVSNLGYSQEIRTVTLAAGQTATVDFELRETALPLAGIVVNAAGQEQRQREIGNSVANISTGAIDMSPVQTLTNLLQGRAAGVVIQPTSGTTGTGSRVRIRGNSSVSLDGTPLILIDGIRVSNEAESTGLFTGGISTTRWDDINPDDIESIEILKGPAASALYGTAAANGVIQITTKSGRGGRTEVRSYVERRSMSVPADLLPDNFRARGFRTDLGGIGDCSLVERTLELCTAVDSLYQFNPLLDATNTPLRDGHTDKLGVSVSGGTTEGGTTFYIGAEQEKGPGVLRGNELDRKSLRANVAGLVNEKLRISAHTNFVTSYIQLPQEGNTGSGAGLNAYLSADPSPGNVARGGGFSFPYTPETVGWWRNEEELRRFVGSVQVDWRPTHWLQVNGVAGVDQNNRFEQSTIPVPGLPTGFFAEGLREQYRTQARQFTSNLNANVSRALTESITSSTAVGVQYTEQSNDWTYAAGSGLAPGTLTTGEALSVQEFFGNTKLFGIYGSETLGLNDRLFLTVAARGDQNSAFGENIGFVTYPAFSGSWIVMEEPWFPQINVLSSLRLRGAYGESGQRPGRLSAVRTYETQSVTLGGGITSGFIVSNAGNPDLKPEKSKEIEFGFDIGLLEDRVAIELTRYDKTTNDALVARPLPPSVGGPTSQFFNLGEVENKGWEGTIHVDALRMENVDARFSISFATNENKLISIGDTTIPPITIGVQRHVEGYPLGGYWSNTYEFADANGDGVIQFDEVNEIEMQDDEDTGLSFLGSPFPKHDFSFNADVNILGMFRISGLLDFKGGHKLFNWSSRLRCSEAAGAFCEVRQVPGAGSLEEQARIIARRKAGLGSQAGFIEDADFWKLRELALTFTVPSGWIDRIGVARSVRVSVAGRNLKTWTDYTGFDPETNIPGSVSSDDDPGRFYTVDLFGVPLPRMWVFRVDLGL